MINKKGFSVFGMFLFLFVAFFLALFLGLALWGFNVVDSVLDLDVEVGQVNLREVNALTFGKMNDAFVNQADTMGILLLLGMSFGMLINAYFLGGKFPKVFIIIDIMLLVFVFIIAVYLSQAYSLFINSSDLLSLFIDDIPKSSKFVLNLPLIVGTLGALIMILSYSGIRQRTEGVKIQEF